MDLKLIEARENIVKAREALRHGDKDTARDLGEKAALLVPDFEDAWLILVAADPNPEDALAYAQKALELNPSSTRAHRAQEWANRQLEKARAESSYGLTVDAISMGQLIGAGNRVGMAEPVRDERREAPLPRAERVERVVGQKSPANKAKWRPLIYVGALFGFLICSMIGVVPWSAFRNPALSSFLSSGNIIPTQEVLWAQVDLAKPSVTPIDVSAFAAQSTEIPVTPPAVEPASTAAPTDRTDIVPPETPSPADEVAAAPEAAETPGVMAMEILVVKGLVGIVK
jgi:hypothetical protein